MPAIKHEFELQTNSGELQHNKVSSQKLESLKTKNKGSTKRIGNTKPVRTKAKLKGGDKPNSKVFDEHTFTTFLLKNMQLKSPELNFLSCDNCDYRTAKRYSLQLHMKRLHMPLSYGKPFFCEVCGIRMSELANLKTHMRIHTGERPFSCTFESCDRRFVSSSELTIHMRRHLGEKPYTCDQCPAAFVSKDYLNKHTMTKHSDLRPFSCAECDKSFKDVTTYKSHLVTHTDIRKYNCDVCGKSFRQLGAFQVHMNIHTDHRPYACKMCGRGFHSSAARWSHEKTFHKLS